MCCLANSPTNVIVEHEQDLKIIILAYSIHENIYINYDCVKDITHSTNYQIKIKKANVYHTLCTIHVKSSDFMSFIICTINLSLLVYNNTFT